MSGSMVMVMRKSELFQKLCVLVTRHIFLTSCNTTNPWGLCAHIQFSLSFGGCYGHDGRVPYIAPGGHDRRVSSTGGQLDTTVVSLASETGDTTVVFRPQADNRHDRRVSSDSNHRHDPRPSFIIIIIITIITTVESVTRPYLKQLSKIFNKPSTHRILNRSADDAGESRLNELTVTSR